RGRSRTLIFHLGSAAASAMPPYHFKLRLPVTFPQSKLDLT
ncbi:MAG: hypothetical protein ACI92G_002311, partial [Candidatus Pelagisphaera sp.]